jgi:16S rRNA (uracil1498-N3)-methyltransferase
LIIGVEEDSLMDLVRFFCDSICKGHVELDSQQSHHLAGVLRLKQGDRVELFDGKGILAVAKVAGANPRKATLQVEDLQIYPSRARGRIAIAVSIAKGERFDWLIGRCTELGVDQICPILFERTVKQAANPKIVERWRNLAVAAAKQCRRVFLPRIDAPIPLSGALEMLKKDYPAGRFLLGSVSSQSQPLIAQTFGDMDVAAFIGPEGGTTEKEEMLLSEAGCKFVRLTDTVLRIETAALAFASILAAQRNAEGR